MTPEEIKSECDLIYDRIQKEEERLAEIQKMCKHEKTYKGVSAIVNGTLFPSFICEYCGKSLHAL